MKTLVIILFIAAAMIAPVQAKSAVPSLPDEMSSNENKDYSDFGWCRENEADPTIYTRTGDKGCSTGLGLNVHRGLYEGNEFRCTMKKVTKIDSNTYEVEAKCEHYGAVKSQYFTERSTFKLENGKLINQNRGSVTGKATGPRR
jgi:hypothetical protein